MNKNIISFIGQFLAALTALGTFMLLARLVSPQSMGDFLLYLSLATFLEMIRLGILHTAVVRGLQATNCQKSKLIGSAWGLALIITGILILAVAILSLMVSAGNGFMLFFKWYWLSALALLPFDFGLWTLQAEGKFGRLTVLRLVNLGGFLLFVCLSWFYSWSSEQLVLGHILSSGLASFWAVTSAASGLKHLRQFHLKSARELWAFGRYSMGTFLGTALLKTGDTVLIGWFLGSSSVAVYALAAKVLEALEVPLRAVVSVALPQLSALGGLGKTDQFRIRFYRYSGWLGLLYVPIVLFLFYKAPIILVWVGGQQYGQDSVEVFRILCLFGLLLPLDRMLGIALDALGKPSLNMLKVMLMTSINFVGDIIALVLGAGLAGVALVSLINIALGVAIGYRQLHRLLDLDIRHWLQESLSSILKISSRFSLQAPAGRCK
jgi:O-antigen/teichoic acid export membrane protein